ncbi:MAG: beta-lactamase family protein [bacterium]|nr:beta-lactamase family protein [bacterium]
MILNRKALILFIRYVTIVIICSSCYPSRVIFWNFADQKDQHRFPNNQIAKSENTFRFTDSNTNPTLYIDKTDKNGWQNIALSSFLSSKESNLAFIIIKNDTIQFKHYGTDITDSTSLTVFSVSKSIISILIGIAERNNLINLEDTVSKYIPELGKGNFDNVTIKHLLSHTSGIRFKESYINPFSSDVAKFYYKKDPIRLIRKLKLKDEPGTRFHYNSANTLLLALILKRVSNRSISELVETSIWSKIGTEYPASWNTYENMDLEKAFCCFNTTASDLAKIGKLMIQNGNWNGEVIVDSTYLSNATQLSNENGSVWKYQWHWQVGNEKYGDYMAQGLYDQYLYMVPEEKIIIVSINDAHNPKTNWVSIFRQIVDQL